MTYATEGEWETVRAMAQSDPIPNMIDKWTESSRIATKLLNELTAELREMDALAETLKEEHSYQVACDLGPIGNAAAAARRDLEKERPTQFSFPKPR